MTFYIWCTISGLILNLQDRYIGISLSAACIALVVFYIADRVKKANYLEAEEYANANLEFYHDSINHAILIKQKWRGQSLLSDPNIASTLDLDTELSFEEL